MNIMTENPYPPENQFRVPITVGLYEHEQFQLLKYLNLHYLGDEYANELNEDGVMVPKYPEKETEEFKNAITNAQTLHRMDVIVTYDTNGKPTLELIEHDY